MNARRPTRKQAPRRRLGGLIDLCLVALALWAMGGRTPLGGLAWYGVQHVRGLDAELPTLTAFFSSGATWTPDEEDFPVLLPSSDDTWVPPGGVPEPWRTATRTVVASGSLPEATRRQLADRPEPTPAEAAMAVLDATWNGDIEGALEALAIGPEQRDRAIQRARAAGEAAPDSYEGHRRYLPGRAARDADRFVGGALSLATVLDLHWPLEDTHHVSSPWGDRLHPVLGRKRFHNGVDLSVPIGTAVHAAQEGRVAVVGEDRASGRFVVIDHGHGVRTSYCHLSEIPVDQGASVGRGEVVALSGNTGRSTGPHLHFVVRIAGTTVDPVRFRPVPEDV